MFTPPQVLLVEFPPVALHFIDKVHGEFSELEEVQYSDQGDIIKFTELGPNQLEKTVFKPLGNGQYELVTTFDQVLSLKQIP